MLNEFILSFTNFCSHWISGSYKSNSFYTKEVSKTSKISIKVFFFLIKLFVKRNVMTHHSCWTARYHDSAARYTATRWLLKNCTLACSDICLIRFRTTTQHSTGKRFKNDNLMHWTELTIAVNNIIVINADEFKYATTNIWRFDKWNGYFITVLINYSQVKWRNTILILVAKLLLWILIFNKWEAQTGQIIR